MRRCTEELCLELALHASRKARFLTVGVKFGPIFGLFWQSSTHSVFVPPLSNFLLATYPNAGIF